MTLDELIASLQEWKKHYPGTTDIRCLHIEDGDEVEWIPDRSDWLPGQPEDKHGVIVIYNSSQDAE